MRASVSTAALILVAFLTSTQVAAARDLPSDGVPISAIVTWLQGHGYQASIQRDATANSDFVSASANGTSWTIYFYECAGGDQGCHQCADACVVKAIQFAGGWNAPGIGQDKLNAWNRDKRYIRTYSDAGGAIWAEYDVEIAPGGTWEQLDTSLATWNTALTEYHRYFGV
jgi:hypothetical protein